MQLVDGWLDIAQEVDYLNKSGGLGNFTPSKIVLHGTAGGTSAVAIAEYFRDSAVQASSHFIIDQTGLIVQGIPCTISAWGNGVVTQGHASYIDPGVNPNTYTISIEHCKASTDNSDNLTGPQQSSSFALVKCLCETYGISKTTWQNDANNPGIIRHADIDPVNRSRCPGPYPIDQLIQYLSVRSKYMEKALQDEWNSTASLFGGTPPRYTSGIAGAWRDKTSSSEHRPGPPITQEYTSNDWNGKPIVVQEFLGSRCEWSNGSASWFDR